MIEGSCHCGVVKWSYPLTIESVTACNCTLCSRYGALWAYGYLENGITLSGITNVYTRGRKINGYHFCSVCGCLTHTLANSKNEQGQIRVAVNLRMVADSSAIMKLPIDHFDGKDKFEDLPQDGRAVKDLWF